jgi:hypothetical protein
MGNSSPQKNSSVPVYTPPLPQKVIIEPPKRKCTIYVMMTGGCLIGKSFVFDGIGETTTISEFAERLIPNLGYDYLEGSFFFEFAGKSEFSFANGKCTVLSFNKDKKVVEATLGGCSCITCVVNDTPKDSLRVVELDGKTSLFAYDSSGTIEKLKLDVCARMGSDAADTLFYHEGVPLTNNRRTLLSYGILKGARVQTALRLRGGAEGFTPLRFVDVMFGETEKVNVTPTAPDWRIFVEGLTMEGFFFFFFFFYHFFS